MLQEAIKKIIMKENLTEKEAISSMNEIMSGASSAAQIGGFLIGLRMKGETAEEITGFARAMRQNAVSVRLKSDYAIDTCGTGGDGGKTFNISTAVAIIAAAGGVKVAKHGNRAVSSMSGSADVLKELGFNIEIDTDNSQKSIDECGMGFLFAPKYHTAMKNVAPRRKELGTRTIFNLIGPLTNPAFVQGQILGIYDGSMTHLMAEVLLKLGSEKAMVVHGHDGLDEITTTSPTTVTELRDGSLISSNINPEMFGIPYSKEEYIKGGSSAENAKIIINILNGEKSPKRDIVVLNSGAALYVGKAVENIKEGVETAQRLIDSGRAYNKLMELLEYNRRIS